jgi:DNA-binding transcriptional MerR regulator
MPFMDEKEVRECSGCHRTKPFEDFCVDRSSPSGHTTRCKECIRKISKEYKKKHPERAQENQRLYRQSHREMIHNRYLFKKYGISLQDYKRMWTGQGGRCAICQKEERLCVDHAHDSGMVRKLLCHGCNMLLGMARDNEEVLSAAIEYLRGSRVEEEREKRLRRVAEIKGNLLPGVSPTDKEYLELLDLVDDGIGSDWFPGVSEVDYKGDSC